MEMKVEETKVMRFTRQLSPVQITVHQIQPENAEYFNNFCSLVTNGEDLQVKSNSRLSRQKHRSTRKRFFFTSKLGLNLRLKREKYYIRSTSSCGAGTWTFRKVDHKNVIKFWNVVLGKNWNQLGWSCEKWRIKRSQGGEIYPTHDRINNEG